VVYPLLAPGQNQNIIICVWFSELESNFILFQTWTWNSF
jgi:hypothetical protein